MKIITLNIWGGRAGKEGLLNFFEQHQDVDIFCLQEVWSAPYIHLENYKAGGTAINNDDIMVYAKQEISEILPDFRSYFRPHYEDNYGLMMLVRKDLRVFEEGEVFVYKEKGYMPVDDVGRHARNIQFIRLETTTGPLTVINFHGLWNGQGKNDSDERLEQSENILKFLRTLNTPYVLCGDFNLNPETESLIKFESFGLRNLIKEYQVTSTRTSHYKKPGKYADYVFTSTDVDIKKFSVLPDEVSDHSPLIIEI